MAYKFSDQRKRKKKVKVKVRHGRSEVWKRKKKLSDSLQQPRSVVKADSGGLSQTECAMKKLHLDVFCVCVREREFQCKHRARKEM